MLGTHKPRHPTAISHQIEFGLPSRRVCALTFGKEMKKLFITAMLAASVGTAPALLILVLVDLVVVRLTNMPSSMMSHGFMG